MKFIRLSKQQRNGTTRCEEREMERDQKPSTIFVESNESRAQQIIKCTHTHSLTRGVRLVIHAGKIAEISPFKDRACLLMKWLVRTAVFVCSLSQFHSIFFFSHFSAPTTTNRIELMWTQTAKRTIFILKFIKLRARIRVLCVYERESLWRTGKAADSRIVYFSSFFICLFSFCSFEQQIAREFK